MQVPSHAPRFGRATFAAMLLAVSTAGCQPLAQSGSRPLAESAPVELGYGTTARARVTSSVASVDSTTINSRQVTSLEDALRGLPGVDVIGSGTSARVRVRGARSILGSNDPLYVVDGAPVMAGFAHVLSSINPRDVARITVLKDGEAAVYGSRGANGVVLITTMSAR